MFNIHEDFNNSRIKKINSRVELQSRELAESCTEENYSPDFKVLGGNTQRNVKYSFTANVFYRWRLQ